jgi:poly-gamma-glutamate capsule biosynthesis protein CapA/YwtB (metallophosphatase superfamily)
VPSGGSVAAIRPLLPVRSRASRVVTGLILVVGMLALTPTRALVAGEGRVFAFGNAPRLDGGTPDDAVAAVPMATGRGLLVAGSAGEVSALGDAVHHGSLEGATLNAPIVGMAATTSGRGYWLVARDGGVFSFGDASFLGSTGDVRLNQPIVGMAATTSGRGYWLVARDGGIFTFGDASFLGSTGDLRLNQPIVGMAPSPTGRGYWLVARDGGIFTFGDAAFMGSTGDLALNEPIVAMAPTSTGRGYRLLARDGGLFTFGDATFSGSGAGAMPDDASAVALAATSDGYWIVAGRAGVRIALAGDVHGERQIADQLRRGENPLSDVASLLASADVAAVNLETPAGRPGTPQSKEFVFNAPPELLAALRGAGVDVVTLANNHALDHGVTTLLDTIDRAHAAGLVVVGAGADAAAAYAPAYVDARGQRIAFVGLSQVVPPGWAAASGRAGVASAYDARAALGAVRAAAAEADVVVVLVHWGVELARCPGRDVSDLAAALRDAGADVIAGSHPHVLQGVHLAPEAVTAYSLGNFVWYHDQPPSDTTGVLEVTADGRTLDATFHPARIGPDGRPRLLSGDEATAVRRSVTAGPDGCWRG